MATVSSAPPEATAHPPEVRRRRRGWRVAVALAVLLLIWLLAVAWSLNTARGHLEWGRAEAVQGREQLLDGDAAAAVSAFDRSQEAFSTADALLSSPVVRPLGVLAVVHEDLRTIRGLARAGALVAEAAGGTASAVAELPGGLRALAPQDGRLPVDQVAALAAPLQDAERLLARARQVFDATPRERLATQVQAAREQLGEQLTQAESLISDAAAATAVLPDFLGAEGPRRYFFAASTPAELRGTGGYLGSYTLLTIDDGRLSFGQFEPVADLPAADLSAVEPPSPDYARRYERYGGAAFWPNINFTPHFPWAATAIEGLWEVTQGQHLDGTIVVDPFAFATLVEAGGAVEVPGIGTVGPDEVVEVVANEAYGAFDDEAQRKAVLGAVAAGALQGFLGQGAGRGAVPALTTLARSAAEGHVQVHAARAEEQSVLERLGVAGALPTQGDLLGVVANQAAASKVDYYVSRSVEATVTLEPDGTAVIDGRVTFSNEAPTEGLPKRVIGPNADGLSAGDDQFFLSLYCGAPQCRLESFTPSTGGQQPREETELGRTVFTTGVVLRSGTQEQVSFRWRSEDAWQGEASSGSYHLAALGQTTIVPTQLRLEVQLPPGVVLSGAPEGAEVDGSTVRWSGEVGRLQEFSFVFGSSQPPPEPLTALERMRRMLSEPLLRFGMFAGHRVW